MFMNSVGQEFRQGTEEGLEFQLGWFCNWGLELCEGVFAHKSSAWQGPSAEISVWAVTWITIYKWFLHVAWASS